MAKPSEKLAQSLEMLHKAQAADGGAAIRAKDLSRTHRERLVKNGFLQPVIKGWYVPSRPDEARGESTAWYASFWGFCAAYLEERFGTHWCLSPEQSLSLHAGNWGVPRQLMVRSPGARNKITKLPHGTSVFDLRAALPGAKDRTEKGGLRVFSVESALIESSPSYFPRQATDVRAVLATVRDSSSLLEHLLDGGHTVIAGRLAGAFRNIGRDRTADEIIDTMSAAGFDVRERNPFADQAPVLIRPRETKDERRRSPLPPKRKKRKRRGVVDTSVLVGGISGFRKPYLRGTNPSADLLYRWAEDNDFVWLVTEEILDEDKEVLKRLGVRPNLIGMVINLIRERAEKVSVRASGVISPDPKDDRSAFAAKMATQTSSSL